MNSNSYVKLALVIGLLSSCTQDSKVVEVVRYENRPVTQSDLNSELSIEQSLENYRKIKTFAEAQKTAQLMRSELQRIEQLIFNSPQSQIKKISDEIKGLAVAIAQISKEDQEQLYNILMANTDQLPATEHLARYKFVDHSDAATELMFNTYYLKANNQKLDEDFSKYARKAIQALTNNIAKYKQEIEAYFGILSGLNGQIDISELDNILDPITRNFVFKNLSDETSLDMYKDLVEYWISEDYRLRTTKARSEHLNIEEKLNISQAKSLIELVSKHKNDLKLLSLSLLFYELPSGLFEIEGEFSRLMIEGYDEIIYSTLVNSLANIEDSLLNDLIKNEKSNEGLEERVENIKENFDQKIEFDKYRVALYSSLLEKNKLASDLAHIDKSKSLDNYKRHLTDALNIYKPNEEYSLEKYFSEKDPLTFFEQESRGELTFNVDLDYVLTNNKVGPGVYNAGEFHVSLTTTQDLVFHPLSLILTHSKDVKIEAKSLIFPNIMTIHNMSQAEKARLIEKHNQEDRLLFYGQKLPEIIPLTSSSVKDDRDPEIDLFCQKEVQNRIHWPTGNINRNHPLEYYPELRSSLTNHQLSHQSQSLSASKRDYTKSAGSISLTAETIIHHFLWAKGEDGLNGGNGIDALTFEDGNYEKEFKIGKIFSCSVKEHTYREEDDICISTRNEPDRCTREIPQERTYLLPIQDLRENITITSYRMEAGSGSSGGNGGNVILNTQSMLGTFRIINSGGKKGEKGADAEGPSLIDTNNLSNVEVKDGKSGEVKFL